MIKTCLIIIANGTEELEAVAAIDILRRAGVIVTIAGETDIVHCANDTKILPDISLHKIKENFLYDLVYLPGGMKGVENIIENEKVIEILQNHNNAGKYIAAICAAPIILGLNGILNSESSVTSHPNVRANLEMYNYSDEIIVESDNIFTSRGAGTAINFALFLAKKLVGIEKVENIKKSIMFSD